jgi:hypothetical protein
MILYPFEVIPGATGDVIRRGTCYELSLLRTVSGESIAKFRLTELVLKSKCSQLHKWIVKQVRAHVANQVDQHASFGKFPGSVC